MSAFSFRRRMRSFGFAFQGAKALLRTQHNAWIHAIATSGVIVAGFYCHLTGHEWALLVAAIALVWMAEAFNTAIEFLADEISEEKRERLGHAKDVGAFAVLVAAISSVVIGAIVFVLHFMR